MASQATVTNTSASAPTSGTIYARRASAIVSRSVTTESKKAAAERLMEESRRKEEAAAQAQRLRAERAEKQEKARTARAVERGPPSPQLCAAPSAAAAAEPVSASALPLAGAVVPTTPNNWARIAAGGVAPGIVVKPRGPFDGAELLCIILIGPMGEARDRVIRDLLKDQPTDYVNVFSNFDLPVDWHAMGGTRNDRHLWHLRTDATHSNFVTACQRRVPTVVVNNPNPARYQYNAFARTATAHGYSVKLRVVGDFLEWDPVAAAVSPDNTLHLSVALLTMFQNLAVKDKEQRELAYQAEKERRAAAAAATAAERAAMIDDDDDRSDISLDWESSS